MLNRRGVVQRVRRAPGIYAERTDGALRAKPTCRWVPQEGSAELDVKERATSYGEGRAVKEQGYRSQLKEPVHASEGDSNEGLQDAGHPHNVVVQNRHEKGQVEYYSERGLGKSTKNGVLQ